MPGLNGGGLGGQACPGLVNIMCIIGIGVQARFTGWAFVSPASGQPATVATTSGAGVGTLGQGWDGRDGSGQVLETEQVAGKRCGVPSPARPL